MHRGRRQRLLTFLALIPIFANTPATAADDPWNAPPLSQDPKVLLNASASFPANTNGGATILLNQMSFRFEQDGRLHQSSHTIYRIDNTQAIRGLSTVSVVWQPWHQKQPQVRARVISPEGQVHQLDSALLRDSPAFEQRPELFDDIRVLGGPLPALSVGALVEVEEVYEETQAAFFGGITRTVQVGNKAPVEKTSIDIDAPTSLTLRYELSELPNARVERTAQGERIHVAISQGPLAALESIPDFTPGNVAVIPELRFSTGESWKDVAAKYSALSEQQIRLKEVEPLVAKVNTSSKDRDTLIRVLVQKLHEEVRYTGVELGISSYVPESPSTVLARHYGDCKDKAALLVAMLRAAEIPAYMALITPGRNEDVRQTLPGFGSFTHAIVYVPGAPELWIDATDEYAQPGELPVMDQGRLALIVRETTTGLTRIPVSRFDQNVSVDRREILFQEFGPARASETIEGHGSFDEGFRRFCDLANEKTVRQIFLAHVKREFGAEDFSDFFHVQARDLTQPIQLKLTLDKVPYAAANSQAAVLWIQAPPVREWLPAELFHDFSTSDKNREDKTSPPRKIDFILPVPFVRESQYHVVIPPGFKLRSLPSDSSRHLGPALIIEKYTNENDGSVSAVMRFELPKQDLSPQDASDLVKAVEDLEKQTAKGIFFDNRAYVLLASGKVKDALAEYRRLIALHPKEALHYSEMASALVSVGLGEAARTEAEQGVAVEPNSAMAWDMNGYVLEHDLIGRQYKKGFNRAGAIKAYEKAVSIDAKDTNAHFNLAVLHEFDDGGQRYTTSADFDAALREYKFLEELPNKPSNTDEAQLYCLYFAHHFDEVIAKGANLKSTPALLGLRVAATSIAKGAQSGVELARSQAADTKERSDALLRAATFLIRLRRYPEAATLQSAGMEISEDPGSHSAQLENLRQTRPYEEILFPKTDPRSSIQRLYLVLFGKLKIAPIDVFSHLVTDAQDKEEFTTAIERQFGRAGLPKSFDGYSDDVVLDWLLSGFHYSVDGSDKVGYRVRVRRGTVQNTAFIAREDDEWKLLELGHGVGPAGVAALAALDRGDLDGARQWIDWGRDEMEVRSNEDPLSGPVFPRIWHKGQTADRSMLEQVAAVMVSGSRWSARSISILDRAVANAGNEELRINLQLALCSALVKVQQWRQLATLAEVLVKSSPQSGTAFHYLATAYMQMQDWSDLERIAHERLSRLPDDPTAVRDLARADFVRGNPQSAKDKLKPLIETSRPNPGDLNEYAWAALFTKKDEADALEIAERANSMTNGKNFAVLHTLACLYADVGREREARQTLLAAMEANHLLEPDDAIWFGFGRIADEYGETESALAAYNRVRPPKKPEPEANSTWALSQQRIRILQEAARTTAAVR